MVQGEPDTFYYTYIKGRQTSTITDWTSELDWRTDIFSLYKPGNTILSV